MGSLALAGKHLGFAPVADARGDEFPGEKLVFLDGEGEDGTAPDDLFIHVVEDEVAQAIDDELALVDFVRLDDVRVRANDQISASINGDLSKMALVGGESGVVFDAPMHERDHEIGFGASERNILPERVFGEPGMTRGGISGGKRIGVDLIISHESDSGITHGLEDGRMRLLPILAAADGRYAAFRQRSIFVHERSFPIVTAVVVGNGDEIKTGVEQAIIGACISAKVIGLGDRRAEPGDDAFQVANGQVEAAQELRGVGEGIRVGGCCRQHVTVDGAAKHDIAGIGQCDGRWRRRWRWSRHAGWLRRCQAPVRLRRGICAAARKPQQGNAARRFQDVAAAPALF